MGKTIANLQDCFLNNTRKERIQVTVYLANGFQIKGIVKGFDSFTLLLESEGKQQLIYKHAISTIVPIKSVNISDNTDPIL